MHRLTGPDRYERVESDRDERADTKRIEMNALAELISRAGHAYGGRQALVGERRSMSFAEVDADSNRLASALALRLGVVKGERVAILLPNCPEFVVADFALMKAGLIRVPVNPRYVAPEIEFILAHCGAAALVTSSAFADVVAEIRERVSTLRTCDHDRCGPWHHRRISLERRARPGQRRCVRRRHDGRRWLHGRLHVGHHRAAERRADDRRRALGEHLHHLRERDVRDTRRHDAACASLAHGSGTKVLPVFAKGGKNVLAAKFSPNEFFRFVETHEVTITWMVPTMVAMLTGAPERDRFDVSSLTTVIYGGAPMPEPVLERALAAFGPIFIQIYGLTEAPHPDLVLAKHEHVPDPFTGKRASAGATGRAATGVRVRLVDADGRDVAPGEVGEIIVSGRHVMAGYWNDPAATAEVLRDGWCYTGDLARVDENGMYTIVDRRKEMIISGGFNVYPREVEDVLYRHAAIAECAVIGVPDATWGEPSSRSSLPSAGASSARTVSAHIAQPSSPASRNHGKSPSWPSFRKPRTAKSTRRRCATNTRRARRRPCAHELRPHHRVRRFARATGRRMVRAAGSTGQRAHRARRERARSGAPRAAHATITWTGVRIYRGGSDRRGRSSTC
jgi:acyl-CoA synthetase (AMP-forming)/AMP-acid ligase II